ncbi:hypothetical protein KP806_08165 [Paenibacillus sp. N4]|uniref:hypothetical protein n=1 Tax=Paenibacillus vietnamensis TaxID=2590547 RepID=UPI001CD08F2D|nr:hypothetical protein [Paenibacillus vietnamensis]MCA0755021.1 hypothetical protein [Paenibacillus vietnamensis]
MNKYTPASESSSFIYNIEVLVEGGSHALALEQLIHSLNRSGLLDYRITSGIQLGTQIDNRKASAPGWSEVPIGTSPPGSAPKMAHQQSGTPQAAGNHAGIPPAATRKSGKQEVNSLNGFDNIRAMMKSNTLIRLIVNKGLGIKLSIPCRIINMDENENLITVYHVDEKQVYTFRLNEIEDFS